MFALDIDYNELYTCKLCQEYGATIIIDGKAMGINKALPKAYARPLAPDAPVIPITRFESVLSCRYRHPM